jgi:hypothetical protein
MIPLMIVNNRITCNTSICINTYMPGGRNTANKLEILRDPLSLEGLVFERALTIKAFITRVCSY